MTLKHIFVSAVAISAGLLMLNAGFKGEPKDALDKRIFTTSLTELRENQPPKKPVEDEMEFKSGKGVFSNMMYEKHQFSWTKYEIKKDSTFMDENQNEVHWIEVEASATDKEDQTMIVNATIEDYDISGTIKITKKDKVKKRYEFSGKEKVKKKK